MINKIIIDGENIELNESSKIPFTHTFAQAKTHIVKFGLDGTSEICPYAFKNCTNLTKIEIPETITTIKRNAFENCSKLPMIELGPNINYIGNHCFDGCDNLEEIDFTGEADRQIPQVYCQVPSQTICFVPDGSKYEEVVNHETIDISGDIEYFTKSPWGQYIKVEDLSELDPEETYYRNKWDNIGNNYKIKEYKDRYPAESLDIIFENNSQYTPAVTAQVSTSENELLYKLRCILYPDNCTNPAVTWSTDKPNTIQIFQDPGDPHYIKAKFLKPDQNGNSRIICKAESGVQKVIRFYIKGNEEESSNYDNNDNTNTGSDASSNNN